MIALSHDNLVNHYRTNFTLSQDYGYSIGELDGMIPWEREIYLALHKERIAQQANT